jgi:NarL family two-component system response regulator LiaR
MTAPITVLIVDDHAVVRSGIRGFLEAQPDLQVLGEAASGAEGVKLAAELVPDVVLMDLAMPEMDGVEATRRIRDASPRTQVVVLTSFHDDAHIFPAIRAGALSYQLKDISPEELVQTVRRTARGEAVLNPQVASRLVKEVAGGRAEQNEPLADLSGRELEVLKLIAEGLSNAEIAGRLVLSQKTVKGHVSNILGKLHLADRTQAAILAWRRGMIRPE